VIAVPEATARELKAWRLESGRPADDQPIIGETSPNAMKLWVALHVQTCAHVIDEVSGLRYPDLDVLIADARAQREGMPLAAPESGS
jgi:hypothetical protein